MSEENQVGPLITNPRGQREWDWLVAQVGEEVALAAIAALKGRRPYPLNVAKALGLSVPVLVAEEIPKAPGQEVFSKLRRVLAGGV